jgi:DNA modification methylase
MDVKIVLQQGDCFDLLKNIKSETINLCVTSPPYSDQRKNTYGGIPVDSYIDWFLQRSEELHRVLRNDGTFILNIKEKVVDGERSTYVLELIQALKKQGWLWTEEYIWIKSNPAPGKWPNRFKDAWERCLQFNKNKQFRMFQDAVKIECSEYTRERAKRIQGNDLTRRNSRTGSNFGCDMTACISEWVYPSNVIQCATESKNRLHSAVFPKQLPEFFIKLFSSSGDWVLDPFMGSGTTGIVAKKLNRHFVGFDIVPDYISLAKSRIFNQK